MATSTYDDATLAYRADDATYVETHRYRDPGGVAFVWIAWALAFAFWAFTMSTFMGILTAFAQPDPARVQGGVDAGGAGWFLMEVVGVIVLGAALAWGAARWATRDKRLDPVTEASTAALYDSAGGADRADTVDRRGEISPR